MELDGISMWNIDFAVYKRGDKVCRAESYAGRFFNRNVTCELELEAGEYVVYVSHPHIYVLFR